MTFNRVEDRLLRLLLVDPSGAFEEREVPSCEASGFNVVELKVAADSTTQPRTGTTPHAGPEETVVVLDAGTEEAVLVAGAAIRRLPRGAGGSELLSRAALGASAWRREHLRIRRRLRLADQLIAFSQQLSESSTPEEICGVLAEHAVQIVGAYTSLLFLRGADGNQFRALPNSMVGSESWNLTLPTHPRFLRSGLITAEEARSDTGAPLSQLGPLFAEVGASTLACVPFGMDRILCLLERRERIFEPEDWDLLQVLTRQAEAAMERVRLLNEVRALALTDALTGLANRRQMDVVLKRSLAAARRGVPLAIVLIDLDHFKRINDERGHLAGDRMLCLVAEHLRGQARGSDLVVRYGGDEFLIVLPREDTTGAEALLKRLRANLPSHVQFSAGIAEFGPDTPTIEQLIEAADRDLLAAKRRRGQAEG